MHEARFARRDARRRAVERPFLADLQGPKLRVGRFAAGKVELKVGQTFVLDDDPAPGDATRVHLPHEEILTSVEPGDRLLMDDGKLELKAVECDGRRIVATVVAGSRISDRKGVSLPDTVLPVGALTDKDRKDLDALQTRIEALDAMNRMHLVQENFRLRNRTYTNDLAALGFDDGCTEDCVYLVSLDLAPNAETYIARFVPNPAGGTNGVNQTGDEACQSFTINALGMRTAENPGCLEGR